MSLHQRLADIGLAPRSAETGTFLLVEGAARTALQARLEFHDEPHRMLWYVDAAVQFERLAPTLFQVSPNGRLDAWLGENFDAIALSVVHARLNHDALCRQLRRFGKHEDESGRYFLRLGDPASLHLYVASLSRAPARVAQFFDHGRIEGIYFRDPGLGLSRQVQALFEQPLDGADRDGCLIWRSIPNGEAG
ncbi:MAG TPA: DUF4123 domain-containing protein [Burkholderiaceae bacterium]|nr:DUF4123 domain-containing protein [Burkholderiaceae bacterium]